jgi:hypothetical protein
LNAPTYGTEVDYTKPPSAATPSLPITAYAGTFSNDLYGDITIAHAENGLVLRLGPARRVFPLTHYDRDVFWYQPVGENAYGPSGVTFTVGADEKAERVTLENLDLHGQGTFVRAEEK